MESRLQELTQKLYHEGVEKANNEAQSIIEKAKADAKKIVDDAKKEAASLKNQAMEDAEQLIVRTKSEIKTAGEQAISILRQDIISLLSKNALGSAVAQATGSKELVITAIKEMVNKWDPNAPLDLSVILPEKNKAELENAFKTEAAALLQKGVELKFESRMSGGFKIAPKDGSYVLSFTNEDFVNFFQSFLRPKAKEILFPGA